MSSGKTPELNIPYPIKTDPDTLTSDIGELAKKVDELLRKQLTKLIEVAKLKVTETIELPSESITSTEIKKEAITDAKIVSGRALVKTSGSSPVIAVRQGTGATQGFLSWGQVNAEGNIVNGSADFTPSKTGTGEYLITWNTAKSWPYSVVVTPLVGTYLARTSNMENKSFAVTLSNSSFALTNGAFCFIVVAAS
jgi:hypothetical protein